MRVICLGDWCGNLWQVYMDIKKGKCLSRRKPCYYTCACRRPFFVKKKKIIRDDEGDIFWAHRAKPSICFNFNNIVFVCFYFSKILFSDIKRVYVYIYQNYMIFKIKKKSNWEDDEDIQLKT